MCQKYLMVTFRCGMSCPLQLCQEYFDDYLPLLSGFIGLPINCLTSVLMSRYYNGCIGYIGV